MMRSPKVAWFVGFAAIAVVAAILCFRITQNKNDAFSRNQSQKPVVYTSIKERLTRFLDRTDHIVPSPELDALSAEFFSDDQMSREEKIRFLLARLTLNPGVFSDSEKYCCDMLVAMKPIEFAKEIIAAFDQGMTHDGKSNLIRILKSSCVYEIPPDQMESAQLQALKENAPFVQDFLAQLIHSGDQSTLVDSLDAYCAMSPPDDSVNMAFNAVNKWLTDGAQSDENVTHTDLLELLVNSGLASSSTQDRVFQALPALLASLPESDMDTFKEFLYRVVESADLTEKAQASLKDYLQNSEPPPAPTSTYFHWLDALTRVNGGEDPVVRLGLIANAIRNSNQPLNIASVVVYGPVEVLQSFSPTELSNLKTTISSSSMTANGESAELFKTAVEAINDYQNGKATPTPQLQVSNPGTQ